MEDEARREEIHTGMIFVAGVLYRRRHLEEVAEVCSNQHVKRRIDMASNSQ